jgi:hypothetical protein
MHSNRISRRSQLVFVCLLPLRFHSADDSVKKEKAQKKNCFGENLVIVRWARCNFNVSLLTGTKKAKSERDPTIHKCENNELILLM